jgi:hypothetical protein
VLEPLLTLALQDLGLDFYALIADRQVRLFTLTADVSLPVGLRFDGCGQVVPVLGDLGTALSNVRAGDSELLAEDPAVLAALVPTLLAAARPALAGSLGAIALPAVAGFRLEGGDARGLGPIAGSAAYRHLAFFTRLAPADGGCAGP